MKKFSTVSVLTLACLAGPGFADVTPDQAWDDLQTYMRGFGYAVTATESMSGSALTVSDLSFAMTIPEEDVSITVAMPDLTYTDNGNGTVTMTMPESGALGITAGPAGEEAEVDMVFAMTHQGFAVVISGDETDTSYSYSAQTLGLRLDEMIAEGEVITRDVFRAEMSMGPMEGTSQMRRDGGMQSIAQALSYGNVGFVVHYDDPDNEDMGSFSGGWQDMRAEGDMTLPMDADFDDPIAIFEAGLAVDAFIAHGGGSMEFNVNDGGDIVTGATSSEGGELSVAMSKASMSYALRAAAQTVEMMVPDLPFPVSGSLAQSIFSMEIPLQASDTPQPAGFQLLLEDLVIADMLWNIFDPGQTLSRGPATVGATLNAQVTPFVSLLDEEQMDAIDRSGGMPGELNSVTLRDLVLRAAGAEVLGTGDFVFDNADLQSFAGFPRPEGKAEFQLSGINGLIDGLIAMGLLQEQDAMGARMGLGMFTIPGSAPDTATSTLEINAQGHILANGQRIQ